MEIDIQEESSMMFSPKLFSCVLNYSNLNRKTGFIVYYNVLITSDSFKYFRYLEQIVLWKLFITMQNRFSIQIGCFVWTSSRGIRLLNYHQLLFSWVFPLRGEAAADRDVFLHGTADFTSNTQEHFYLTLPRIAETLDVNNPLSARGTW